MNLNSYKQNLEPLDLADRNSGCQQQSKQITILFEYKILQMYGSLLGIYAIPNLQDYTVWNCIIFIRKGFYKDGKFKFDVFFDQFPQKAPKIIFKSTIFHSLVREADGLLDTKEVLGEEWCYQNQNMLYSLFSKMERMFNDKNKMENRSSYNPEAAKMLAMKPHTFIERALRSVESSKQNLYQNQPGTSLVIKKYENGQLEPYKLKLGNLCEQNKAPQQKKKQFLNFVLTENQ